jgi:hypothetical protein
LIADRAWNCFRQVNQRLLAAKSELLALMLLIVPPFESVV